VIGGIGDRGAWANCEAVLSGYLGEVALGEVVLAAATAAKAANPGALYCCDPVIGDDHTGVFVKPGIAEFFRDRAIPTADILTPNRFELALLVEREIAGVDDALAAAAALRRRGPRLVLVTSLVGDGGEIAILAAGNDGAFLVGTPRLPILADGAGDLTAALFLGYFLKTGDAGAALGETASAVYAVIEATTRSGQPELQIVAAQDAIVSPPRQFIARKIA
jgi:pyridoxine kinase